MRSTQRTARDRADDLGLYPKALSKQPGQRFCPKFLAAAWFLVMLLGMVQISWAGQHSGHGAGSVSLPVFLSFALSASALCLAWGVNRNPAYRLDSWLRMLSWANVLLGLPLWVIAIALAAGWIDTEGSLLRDSLWLPTPYGLALMTGIWLAAVLTSGKFDRTVDALLHALLGLGLIFIVVPLVLSLLAPWGTGFQLAPFGTDRLTLSVAAALMILVFFGWVAWRSQDLREAYTATRRPYDIAMSLMPIAVMLPLLLAGAIFWGADGEFQRINGSPLPQIDMMAFARETFAWVLAAGVSILIFLRWSASRTLASPTVLTRRGHPHDLATAFMIVITLLTVIFGTAILRTFDSNRQRHIESLLLMRADLMDNALLATGRIAQTVARSPDILQLLTNRSGSPVVGAQAQRALQELLPQMIQHRIVRIAVFDRQEQLLAVSGQQPSEGDHLIALGDSGRSMYWGDKLVVRQRLPLVNQQEVLGSMSIDMHLPEISAGFSTPERFIDELVISLCLRDRDDALRCLAPRSIEEQALIRGVGPGYPSWPVVAAAKSGERLSGYIMSTSGPTLIATSGQHKSSYMLVGVVGYDALREPLAPTLRRLALALSLIIVFAAFVVRFPFERA